MQKKVFDKTWFKPSLAGLKKSGMFVVVCGGAGRGVSDWLKMSKLSAVQLSKPESLIDSVQSIATTKFFHRFPDSAD